MRCDPTRRTSEESRPVFVLLAEDQDDFRELLARGLEAGGAVVDCVRDGQAALAKILDGRFRPDVIVSDVRMPKKSGLDVVREVRAAGLTTPIILLTGFGDSINHETLNPFAGTVLIEKPFDLDDLRTALRNLPAIASLRSRSKGPR